MSEIETKPILIDDDAFEENPRLLPEVLDYLVQQGRTSAVMVDLRLFADVRKVAQDDIVFCGRDVAEEAVYRDSIVLYVNTLSDPSKMYLYREDLPDKRTIKEDGFPEADDTFCLEDRFSSFSGEAYFAAMKEQGLSPEDLASYAEEESDS